MQSSLTLESYTADGSDRQELLHDVVDVRAFPDEPLTTAAGPARPRFVGDTDPKSGSGSFGFLVDVRWGIHDEFTRVVFEFRADAPEVPNWWVRYSGEPFDRPVPPFEVVTGDHLLWVEMTPATGLDISDPANTVPSYTGPLRIPIDSGAVLAINLVEDFEAYMAWVIEVDGQRPFRVLTFEEPARLAVDIAN